MEILLIAVVAIINTFCFLIGAKVGQTVSKGESVELPTVNPLKAVEERRNKKEAEREQDKVNAILHNIEAYDGTGRGQEDIPRG
jgi:hypothetical protein